MNFFVHYLTADLLPTSFQMISPTSFSTQETELLPITLNKNIDLITCSYVYSENLLKKDSFDRINSDIFFKIAFYLEHDDIIEFMKVNKYIHECWYNNMPLELKKNLINSCWCIGVKDYSDIDADELFSIVKEIMNVNVAKKIIHKISYFTFNDWIKNISISILEKKEWCEFICEQFDNPYFTYMSYNFGRNLLFNFPSKKSKNNIDSKLLGNVISRYLNKFKEQKNEITDYYNSELPDFPDLFKIIIDFFSDSFSEESHILLDIFRNCIFADNEDSLDIILEVFSKIKQKEINFQGNYRANPYSYFGYVDKIRELKSKLIERWKKVIMYEKYDFLSSNVFFHIYYFISVSKNKELLSIVEKKIKNKKFPKEILENIFSLCICNNISYKILKIIIKNNPYISDNISSILSKCNYLFYKYLLTNKILVKKIITSGLTKKILYSDNLFDQNFYPLLLKNIINRFFKDEKERKTLYMKIHEKYANPENNFDVMKLVSCNVLEKEINITKIENGVDSTIKLLENKYVKFDMEKKKEIIELFYTYQFNEVYELNEKTFAKRKKICFQLLNTLKENETINIGIHVHYYREDYYGNYIYDQNEFIPIDNFLRSFRQLNITYYLQSAVESFPKKRISLILLSLSNLISEKKSMSLENKIFVQDTIKYFRNEKILCEFFLKVDDSFFDFKTNNEKKIFNEFNFIVLACFIEKKKLAIIIIDRLIQRELKKRKNKNPFKLNNFSEGKKIIETESLKKGFYYFVSNVSEDLKNYFLNCAMISKSKDDFVTLGILFINKNSEKYLNVLFKKAIKTSFFFFTKSLLHRLGNRDIIDNYSDLYELKCELFTITDNKVNILFHIKKFLSDYLENKNNEKYLLFSNDEENNINVYHSELRKNIKKLNTVRCIVQFTDDFKKCYDILSQINLDAISNLLQFKHKKKIFKKLERLHSSVDSLLEELSKKKDELFKEIHEIKTNIKYFTFNHFLKFKKNYLKYAEYLCKCGKLKEYMRLYEIIGENLTVKSNFIETFFEFSTKKIFFVDMLEFLIGKNLITGIIDKQLFYTKVFIICIDILYNYNKKKVLSYEKIKEYAKKILVSYPLRWRTFTFLRSYGYKTIKKLLLGKSPVQENDCPLNIIQQNMILETTVSKDYGFVNTIIDIYQNVILSDYYSIEKKKEIINIYYFKKWLKKIESFDEKKIKILYYFIMDNFPKFRKKEKKIRTIFEKNKNGFYLKIINEYNEERQRQIESESESDSESDSDSESENLSEEE